MLEDVLSEMSTFAACNSNPLLYQQITHVWGGVQTSLPKERQSTTLFSKAAYNSSSHGLTQPVTQTQLTAMELNQSPGWKDLLAAQIAGMFAADKQRVTVGTTFVPSNDKETTNKARTKTGPAGVLKPSSFSVAPAATGTPAEKNNETSQLEPDIGFGRDREIDCPNAVHYVILRFKEDYTDEAADFVLSSVASAFAVFFKHIGGCKIWHRDGSSTLR